MRKGKPILAFKDSSHPQNPSPKSSHQLTYLQAKPPQNNLLSHSHSSSFPQAHTSAEVKKLVIALGFPFYPSFLPGLPLALPEYVFNLLRGPQCSGPISCLSSSPLLCYPLYILMVLAQKTLQGSQKEVFAKGLWAFIYAQDPPAGSMTRTEFCLSSATTPRCFLTVDFDITHDFHTKFEWKCTAPLLILILLSLKILTGREEIYQQLCLYRTELPTECTLLRWTSARPLIHWLSCLLFVKPYSFSLVNSPVMQKAKKSA